MTWLLDENVTFINHGSFGACPRPVLEAQHQWQERLEREPIRFMDGVEAHLDQARGTLAGFLGAQVEDLVFVPNATAGINTVLRSLDFSAGDDVLTTDHEYNACLNAIHFVAARSGAKVIIARVPFPIASAEEVTDAILSAVTPRTRLAVISHITSPTALVLPIERIVAALADRGIDTLVDGAHAPGMVPLQLDSLNAAYYTGNAHKWLCAPKGSGFLHVRRDRQERVRPLVISHGANSLRRDRSRFWLEFDWTGTSDPSPYLAIPTAIEFLASLHPAGWLQLAQSNHELALAGRDRLLADLRQPLPAPAEMLGSMAAVVLPADLQPHPPESLHDLLQERHAIQVPVYAWPHTREAGRDPLRLLRISAQAYNSAADYERLAAVLTEMRTTPP